MDTLVWNTGKLIVNGFRRWDDHKKDNEARALGAAYPAAVARGPGFDAPNPITGAPPVTPADRHAIVTNLLRYRGTVTGPAPVNPNPPGTPAHARWAAESRAARRPPFVAGSQAHAQWVIARNAYAARPANEHDLLDRRMILRDGLTREALLQASTAYERLDNYDTNRVRRFLPGSTRFEQMRESAQRLVYKKVKLHEEPYELAKPLIRTFLPKTYSRYGATFDPDKRYPYPNRWYPSETIRVAMWETNQVMSNFQRQMEAITTLPQPGTAAATADRFHYKWIREWFIGVGGTIDKPNNTALVGQIVFSLETIWNNMLMLSLRAKHTANRLTACILQDLEKHVRYGTINDDSVYWNLSKERVNKALAAYTPQAPKELAYYDLLAAQFVG